MKKKVYVALLSLCCPIMLNTQQVFAEETTPTGDTVVYEEPSTESSSEELPTVPTPEASEEVPEATEETTEATEEAVTEETDTSEETAESTEAVEEATRLQKKFRRCLHGH